MVFYFNLINIIGQFRILDGNHRLVVFKENGVISHPCNIFCPVSAEGKVMSFQQLQVLMQGNNFINSNGVVKVSELEILVTLQRIRKDFIKEEKSPGVVSKQLFFLSKFDYFKDVL